MAYRTILVHVDRTPAATARIRLAAQLALRENAHLVGAAISGMPAFMYAGDPFDASGELMAAYLELASQRADAALAHFDELAAASGLASFEHRKCQEDEYSAICLQARYADLVVLGQSAPGNADQGQPQADLPQHVLLHGGRPVLVVPHSGQFDTLGERPLLAWNGSLEAAHAATAAIPLLQRAARTTVAVFNARSGLEAHGEEAGADIAQYLARHGVQVEVQRLPAPDDSGAAILALAASLRSDLLVMGAYGHSRFREMMLGGATRTVLATATLPVLMAH